MKSSAGNGVMITPPDGAPATVPAVVCKCCNNNAGDRTSVNDEALPMGRRGTADGGPDDTSAPSDDPPCQCEQSACVPKYGWKDVVSVCISLATYIFDQVTDIILAIYFFHLGKFWYFGLTLAFVLTPALTMTAFNLAWYYQDYTQQQRPRASRLQWFFRVLFLVFHFGPILRYFESLVYGCKSKCSSKKKKDYFYVMIYEDTDAGLLRLFECFMESAPQLVLQIYILTKNDIPETVDHPYKIALQAFSISSSLISLSWAMASYNRSLRFSLDDKMKMTWVGTFFQFSWQFFCISSRVVSLALFASVFPFYSGAVVAAHWVIMTGCIIAQKTEFCEQRWEEVVFDMVMGVIYIFCFFNVKDEKTRLKYIFYYMFILLEGTGLMVTWFLVSDPSVWYRYPAFAGFYASFALGIALMCVYYRCFHPSMASKHRVSAHLRQGDGDVANGDGVCGGDVPDGAVIALNDRPEVVARQNSRLGNKKLCRVTYDQIQLMT